MLSLVLFIKEAKPRGHSLQNFIFFFLNTVSCTYFHHKSIYRIQSIVIIYSDGIDLGNKLTLKAL